MAVYKILCHDGRFDHVEGYGKALQRAATMADAPSTATETELKEYGVSIAPCRPSEARAVGLGKETLYGGAKTMRLPKETK